MGCRMSVGVGYGVLMTPDEARLADQIEKKTKYYFKALYAKWNALRDSKDEKKYATSREEDNFSDMLWVGLVVDAKVKEREDATRKEMKERGASDEEIQMAILRERPKLERSELRNLFYDKVLYPNEEVGSKSFFGYVPNHHYGDEVCYLLVFHFVKKDLKAGETLEIRVDPVDENEVAKYKENITNEGGFWHISEELMWDDRDLQEALMNRKVEKGNHIKFASKEECVAFYDDHYKKRSYEGMHYATALGIVKQTLPNKSIGDIERYLVAWWS